MQLKISPALVVFLFGILMWGLDQYIHPDFAVFTVSGWWFRLIFGIGIGVGVLGLFQFIKNRTTIDPHRPDNAAVLVTNGIYRISRNPMYLALLICLIGFAVKLGNIFSFLPVPLFFIYMNKFQIQPEEKVLREKFDRQFEVYTSQVRRWV